MNLLKPLLFSFLLSYSYIATSQLDVKGNPIAWAFGEVGILAEYSLSENTSAQLGVSMGSNFQEFVRFEASDYYQFKTRGIKMTPSFRRYIIPQDITDGVYLESFLLLEFKKAANVIARNVPVDANGMVTEKYKSVKIEKALPYNVKYRKFGVGFNYGYKQVNPNGFIIELYFGPAFHIINNETHENPDLIEFVTDKNENYEKPSNFFFNFGGGIGWRF